MNYTSIEDSQALLKAGLKNTTADMMYWIDRKDCRIPWEEAAKDSNNISVWVRPFGGGPLSGYGLSCWSAGRLMDMLPAEIPYTDENGENQTAGLDITKFVDCPFMHNQYRIGYGDFYESYYEGTLVECCVDLIIWLLEHKHYLSAV